MISLIEMRLHVYDQLGVIMTQVNHYDIEILLFSSCNNNDHHSIIIVLLFYVYSDSEVISAILEHFM